MKTLFPLAVIVIIVLTGCGSKTATIEHSAPNGQTKLTVVGTRKAPLDNWQVELKVKAYSWDENSLRFEIAADDLSEENVNFNWTDDSHCLITFKQRDNTERKFQLVSSAEALRMGEI